MYVRTREGVCVYDCICGYVRVYVTACVHVYRRVCSRVHLSVCLSAYACLFVCMLVRVDRMGGFDACPTLHSCWHGITYIATWLSVFLMCVCVCVCLCRR